MFVRKGILHSNIILLIEQVLLFKYLNWSGALEFDKAPFFKMLFISTIDKRSPPTEM